MIGAHLVDAELVERLQRVELALAAREMTPMLGAGPPLVTMPVELVGAGEGQDRAALLLVQRASLASAVSPSRMLRPAGGMA